MGSMSMEGRAPSDILPRRPWSGPAGVTLPALGDAVHWWHGPRFSIGWKGHLFLAGHGGGPESVVALAALLEQHGLDEVAPRIHGVFGLFVHDAERAVWQAMTDNGGLYKLFYDDARVATSFLELSRARGASRTELSPPALIEYLAFGQLLGEPTFLSTVRKLRGDEIAEIGPAPDDRVRIRRKRIDASAGGDLDTVLGHMRDLAASLAGRRVSVDGTGGFDSRLLLCLMDWFGAEFEIATSGQPGNPDTEIPREIARILEHPFHLSGHDLDRLEDDLPVVFRAGDGLTDLRRFHRDLQLAEERLRRGVDLIVHGGGGELFRDHYIIQDFPRYGSPVTNFDRWYDLRMMPVRLPAAWLGRSGAAALGELRPRTLARLESYHSATNNESYNRAYYFLRAPEHFGQHHANYINMGLDVAAPLLDHGVVRAALALPPWQQFFHRWHRQVITRHHPAVAALRTADGFSASAKPALMLRDLTSFGALQVRRVARKVSQRLFGKGRFYVAGAFAADAPGFIAALRTTRHFATAVDRLKAVDVLAPDLALDQIADIHVGRMLTAGMFVDSLPG
jgi:hypothetical protein